MGFGKIFKKAISAVTKPVQKAVGAIAGTPDMPTPVDAPQQALAAQIIEPPEKDKADADDESTTESGKKKAARGGKKSLSVARSSGSGINI